MTQRYARQCYEASMRPTVTMSLFCGLSVLVLAACPPDGTGTSDDSTSGISSVSASTSGSTSEQGTSTTDAPTTGTTELPPAPVDACANIPDDPECMCEDADASFCADLDAFCRNVVHLDLSLGNPPGTDYCDTIGAWCASPGTSTYSACDLLESTCKQVAPSGDVSDCAGLRDICACDDFNVTDVDTTTGGVMPDPPAFKPGAPNGPCDEGKCTGQRDSGAPNECRVGVQVEGDICSPMCNFDEDCSDGTACFDSNCIWPCFDASDCPFPGMGCEASRAPSFCMWQNG